MEEIEAYIEEKEKKVQTPSLSDDPISFTLKQLEFGEILISLCFHKKAIHYLEQVWNRMLDHLTNKEYKQLLLHAGISYTMALDYIGEFAKCEVVFLKLNDIFQDGVHLGDYAYFLHRRKREFDKAEEFYRKAILYFPTHSSIHLKYAGFLRHVRRNISAAEEHYTLAVEHGKDNADAVGNYASFLHGVHRKLDEAEIYYKKSIELDQFHANNLCNYGLFLSEERQNIFEAERMYRQALDVSPNHSNTLYNYAVLLDSHLKRKEEAEIYYRRTLEIEPRHAYALYNLAVLLEEKHFSPESLANKRNEETLATQKAETCAFYRRAAEADPRDSTTLADYGRFTYLRMEEFGQAESLLGAALKLDNGCEVALYHLGLLYHREKKNYSKAESLFKVLLTKNPKHSNGTLALARLYVDWGQGIGLEVNIAEEKREQYLDEAVILYEKAVTLAKDPSFVVSEYLKFVSLYGTNRQKLSAIKTMSPFVAKAPEISLDSKSANLTESGNINSNPFAQCRDLMDELKMAIQSN